ncbi:unnamed protein product, partial [Discosporangium mesarthrocarpum]
QGRKRWRVYSPPPPSARPKADPLARGKGNDVLSLEELQSYGPPLLDVVVAPGQMLYVPTGFPHTTDTVTRIELEESGEAASPSVHLTMGVDSH